MGMMMDGDDGDVYKSRLDGWMSIWMLMDGGLMDGWTGGETDSDL